MTTQIRSHLPRFAALSALPPGYTLARRLTLESPQTVLVLNLLGLFGMALCGLILVGVDQLLNALYILPLVTAPWNADPVPLGFLILVAFIAVLAVHELCHGLGFRLFDARPRYGVNLSKGVAYASAGDYYLTRDAYLIVALLPLTLITIASLILVLICGDWLRFAAGVICAANAGGSVGDLWFVLVCRRFQHDLLVRDFGDGAELFICGGEPSATVS